MEKCAVKNLLACVLSAIATLMPTAACAQDDFSKSLLGLQPDGRIVVPTNQVLSPHGRQTWIPSRANDLALSPDSTKAAVLGHGSILLVDAASGLILAATDYTKTEEGKGGSYSGIAFTPDGKRVVAINIGGAIDILNLPQNAERTTRTTILLKDNNKLLIPSGLQLSADGAIAYTALCIANELAEIDLAKGQILRRIPVGNVPIDVCIHGDKAYVANMGGGLPGAGDVVAPSANWKPVKVDPKRFIASEGTVSVVDLKEGRELAQIQVGLHPNGMAISRDGIHLFVCNGNSDTVSVVDTAQRKVVETISTRPQADLIFGSSPNDAVLSEDEKRLFVSNGTNNSICVIELGDFVKSSPSRVVGFLPSGWYPAGLEYDAAKKELWVANIKGSGSRRNDLVEERPGSGIKGGLTLLAGGHLPKKKGYNSHEHAGSVSRMEIPSDEEIHRLTGVVAENNRLTESISAMAPPRTEAAPKPIPDRHGEPSVFEHVVYIIKENRTYDQIFGDMPIGNGDPNLCIYGEEVTPNCHKLVRDFVLLDNFYCSGVLSADGHQWVTEAFVTGYLEKAFGGFPRSYPYDGGDSMAYASSGFLWDNCFEHGKTFRTYGEFVNATVRWKDPARQAASGRPRFKDCYEDYTGKKGEVEIIGKASIPSLVPHTCTRTIGFPSIVSDQYRADVFIEELRQFEEKGGFPNLSMILLPNDHTSGTRPNMPVPRAAVADNDLALGRIIEAISKSRFWSKTCILVVQDDPQDGFDHVDGHRTLAMAISPYTKRGQVISTNYTQVGMARTIELMLGLPPMNQLDSSAIPMTECFTETADLNPYAAVPARVRLDELNPEVSEIQDPDQLYWAQKSLEIPLEDVDEAPEDIFNRILWHDAKGYKTPYPEQYADAEESDEE